MRGVLCAICQRFPVHFILRPLPAFRAVTGISAVFMLIGPPWIVHRLGSHAGTRMSRDESWRRNDSAVHGFSSGSVPRKMDVSWGFCSESTRSTCTQPTNVKEGIGGGAHWSIQPLGRSPMRPRDALGVKHPLLGTSFPFQQLIPKVREEREAQYCSFQDLRDFSGYDWHLDRLQPHLFCSLCFILAGSPVGLDRRLPQLQPRQLPSWSPCSPGC